MKQNKVFNHIQKLVPFILILMLAFSAGCVIPDVVPEGIIPGTTTTIPPVENPEPEKQSAPDYLTKYSVTPVAEFYDIFHEGDKICIRYVIAEVKDATLSELGSVHNSGGIQSLSVTTSDSWSSRTKEALTNTIRDVVTWGISGSIGASVSTPVSIGEVGASLGISGGYQSIKEMTTTKSIETVVSRAHEEIVSYEIDLTQYPVDNKYYRVAMKGDCLIVQTLVYDLNKQKLDTTYNIIDCVVTGSPRMVIESSDYEDAFQIPESYSSGVSIVTSVDLSDILPGSGTPGSPYLISNEEECLYVIMNPSAYYKLTENIEMDGSRWFDFDKYESHIDLNGHHIYKPGSERNPYRIASADDFMKIYDELSAHYVMTTDIDITDCRLPVGNSVFTGSLDGGNHKITSSSNADITITTESYTEEKYFGLFSKNHGTIKNLELQGFTVISGRCQSGKWVYMGCLAGQNTGTISNIKVTNSRVESERAGSSIGLIVGKNAESGSIENCKVSGGYVFGWGDGGGVAGKNYGDIKSVSIIGNGVSGDDVEEYQFMYHFNQAWTNGEHTGQGRSWGGVVGYADSTSDIRDVQVQNVFIRTYIAGATGTCHFGYIVGYNKGTVHDTCEIINCDNRYSAGILGGLVSAHNWFRVGEGAVGGNAGGVIPSDW